MKFAEADTGSGHLILGYEPGRILIGNRAYSNGLVVSPERVVTGWGPERPEDFSAEHFEAIIELDPQVVILGTGERQVFPDPLAYLALLRQGLGVEVMDTGAACRTYNILMSEGRKVVAGLIMF
ncbi:MAG: Mth938-like domain-containing protein [Chromatiaceae bacterium]|jgi:uncharacterized protein|nr:Mth938-like domain-containing protein [Chromatiaceae bacterium]